MAASIWDRLTPKQRVERAKRLAKNPNTRASIPTKYLKGFAGADKLRAQRALNQRLNQPIFRGASMTNRDLARQAKALTEVAYGPQRRALSQQLQQIANLRQAVPGWFDQYRQTLENLRAQTQASSQALADQVRQLQAGNDRNVGQEQVELLRQQAATAGTQIDPSLVERAVQAAAVRSGLLGDAAAQIQGRGQADATYLGTLAALSQQRQASELARIAAQQMGLLGQQRDLEREAGMYDVQQRERISDREWQRMMEKLVFQADVSQNQAKLTAQRESDRRKAREEGQRINKWGYTNDEWRRMTPAQREAIIARQRSYGRSSGKSGGSGRSSGGGGGLGVSERNKRREGTNNLLAIAQWVRDLQTGPNRQRNRAGIINWAKSKHPKGIGAPGNRVLLDAAIDLAVHGRIREPSRSRVRAIGLDPAAIEKTWPSRKKKGKR